MRRASFVGLILAAVGIGGCGSYEVPLTTVATGSDLPHGSNITATTSTTTSPSTTSSTQARPQSAHPALRVATTEHPLHVWIIGDSFIELFGPSLVSRCADTGVIEAVADFRYISGLTRPDFFDWPAYIEEELPEMNPDVAVVMFGGNDSQPVVIDGERFEVGTEGWVDLYAMRVAEAMDVLLRGVDRVYWIGLPIMKSGGFTANARMMNAVYETEAAERPRMTYISSFELFQDENGEYSAYLDGKQVRFNDGAHFVWNGAYRLADAVLPVIATDWGIDLGQ